MTSFKSLGCEPEMNFRSLGCESEASLESLEWEFELSLKAFGENFGFDRTEALQIVRKKAEHFISFVPVDLIVVYI